MAQFFKSLNTGTISAGSSGEVEWTLDRDYTLKAVIISERSDQSLTAVKAFVQLGDAVKTKDYVIAEVLGRDWDSAWKPEVKLTRGTRIYFKFTNESSTNINIDVNMLFKS